MIYAAIIWSRAGSKQIEALIKTILNIKLKILTIKKEKNFKNFEFTIDTREDLKSIIKKFKKFTYLKKWLMQQ